MTDDNQSVSMINDGNARSENFKNKLKKDKKKKSRIY